MRTLKRIGLFLLLKVLEIGGIIILILGMNFLLDFLHKLWGMTFIFIGVGVCLVFILSALWVGNWDYVKRKIK